MVRLINRYRGDAVKELYVERKYRTPYRGYPAVYDGSRGATLEITIKGADGVFEEDVELQLPGMDSYQVKALIALAYPVPSDIQSIVYNTGLMIEEGKD
eukprot:4342950-Karenia_brevis.AAC.1